MRSSAQRYNEDGENGKYRENIDLKPKKIVMPNIVLFGLPGSGKGVQAQLLVKRYNLVSISPGNIFREEIQKSSPLGKQIKQTIEQGNLLPDTVVAATVQQTIEKMEGKAHGFLFDGYPRSLKQTQLLHDQLAKKGEELDLCICLEVNPEEVVERLKTRKVIAKRLDDEMDSVHNRILLYKSYSLEILTYYRKKGKLVRIDGKGRVEKVNEAINQAIDHYLTAKN